MESKFHESVDSTACHSPFGMQATYMSYCACGEQDRIKSGFSGGSSDVQECGQGKARALCARVCLARVAQAFCMYLLIYMAGSAGV